MDEKGRNNIDPEVSREKKCCQQLPPYLMATTYVDLLTSIFVEKVFTLLSERNELPDKWKECRKDSRGAKDQLLIDNLKHCKRHQCSVAIG